jgi:DNA-binding transcriptional LysR family regulator
VHASHDDAHDVDLVPLYAERYVLLSSADMLPSGASTLRWPDAAQLPLALLTADMRDRQIIDEAFAGHGITVTPQVETDSVASLLAQVVSGNWACIIPHTWLWTAPLGGEIRAVEMIDPVVKAEITLATNAAGPGSPVARALIAAAHGLALDEFFNAQLLGVTHRR